MASKIELLSALKVSRAKTPGLLGDGAGLYLQVTKGGARSWIYRFTLAGKTRDMGIGPLATVSLAEARTAAAEARKLARVGIDPIERRKAARAQTALDAAKAITFKEAAGQFIASHKAGWRNAKHAAQWSATLATYAEPIIGALPVGAIDTGLVFKVLEPIWATKPETAGRVRGRLEAILDWARVRGYRAGENPARWRGHLDSLLPARAKVRKVEHHAALPYVELPAFMTSLRAREGNSARALEFAILTATRTSETLGARWAEIDLAAKVWTIPPDRVKGGREHRIPLSRGAVAVIGKQRDADPEFAFPGGRARHALSNMSMLMVLRRMERGDLTAHGFRSTFRDWAAERTSYPAEVAEMALAHAVGDKVEAAYRRGDLFEKRRRLMDAWGEFCAAPAPKRGDVVPIAALGGARA